MMQSLNLTKEEIYNSHYYKGVEYRNKYAIMLFFKNNAYLLKLVKKTLAQQLKEIEATGVILKRSYVQKLRYGEKINCPITYLNFFSEYWNLPLSEMIKTDFGKQNYGVIEILNPIRGVYALWKAFTIYAHY
jgi:hypothetical protein